jgi:signal transduction histidine kinase/HAMP domain-containing protein
VTLGLVVIIAIYSARAITSPIIELTAWARQIAQGRLISREIKTPVNEIGVLNKTFVELVDSLQEVVSNIEALSLGHLGQKIAPKSDEDVLVLALNHLNKAMYSIVSQAETIADGSYVTNIKPRSNNDLLGNALVKMTENLRKADLHNVEQDWIKTSQAELSKIINGDKDLSTLANEVICYITKRVNGQVGTIYVVDYPDDRSTLLLQGGYAIEEQTKTSISIGEGLVGQAAKEQTFILLQELPQGYLYINSTLGQTAPKSVVIFPFCSNDKLSAVIEIASLGSIDEKHLEFIRLASESVAIAFKSSFIRLQTENLLEETRKQSDELKYQKEELRISNETLRTNTQTLEAQQKVLEKAQIQALEKAVALEEASKYKSEFLANMSHELRTPLNSLLILARSLAENDSGNLSGDEIESAEVILDSGQHLLELINDVLDLSKIEAGQMTIHYEEVYLSELASAMNSRFKHMADEKDLTFEIHIDKGVPACVISDNVKVTQILTNLLSNAIKFTSIGRVELKISLRQPMTQSSSVERTLVFEVVDTGVGIASSKQAAIFSAFVQEDGSISRNYGGTGLGLSIVTSLANLLGADVEVKSQPNQGSTFSFLLPLRDSDTPTVSSARHLIPQVKPIKRPTIPAPFDDDRHQINPQRPLLLIIEDDQKFAKILFNACHKLQCQAIICPDGESGLNLLEQYEIDWNIISAHCHWVLGRIEVMHYFAGLDYQNRRKSLLVC